MTTTAYAVAAEECECQAAVARVQATGQATLCADCGEPLAPTERPSHVGLARSARVQVADEARLRPSTVPPAARLTHVESADEVRVRRLLCELRPDATGPLGVGPSAVDGAVYGSSWAVAVRVQTSVEVPAILPGAFAGSARPSPGTVVAARIDALAEAHPGEAAVLRWLQRTATLAHGLRALYTDTTATFAPSKLQATWKVLAPSLCTAARVGYGAKRVEAAAALWWGE